MDVCQPMPTDPSVCVPQLIQVGGNVTLLSLVAVLAVLLLLALSRRSPSGKLYTLRACRQRSLLLAFLAVLLVYFMCYTTMWMNVSHVYGSFRNKAWTPLSSAHDWEARTPPPSS